MMHYRHIGQPTKLLLVCPLTNWCLEKTFYLPVELEHKALRDFSKLNMDWEDAFKSRVTQLYKLEDF